MSSTAHTNPTATSDQLAVARAVEADRQRRARRYGTGADHDTRRGTNLRVVVPAILLALAVAVGVTLTVTGSTPADEPAQLGATAGLADGWYQPEADTTAAVTTVSLADPVPLRQGTAPGMVDGWYQPGQDVGTTDVAIQQGFTAGLADGFYEPGSDTGSTIPTYPVGRVR
jgi:hypothetical protein